MRTALIPALCLLFAAATAWAAESPTLDSVRARLEAGEPTRIVCFGDSITGAYYHTGGVRAWCDMLGVALERLYPHCRLEMINAGVSGHTTQDGLGRIDADVIAKQPQLVVVMFGMNDVTRLSLEDYAANLRAIVAKCRAAGAAVLLCTPNAVHENTGRPNSRLAEFSQRERDLAKELELPLTDCFAEYDQLRQRDARAFMLLMSDEIHPNMHGHKRFAEQIARTIANRDVDLDDAPALPDSLRHTFARLKASGSVHIVAMAPMDRWLPEALRKLYPSAQIRVTTWPTASRSVADLRAWAAGIRDLKPDLVVPAVPADAPAGGETAGGETVGDEIVGGETAGGENAAEIAAYIRDYEWILNFSFPFAGREWDVLPVLPSLVGPVADDGRSFADTARRIVLGKDVRFLERAAGDERPGEEILAAWIEEQKE